MPSNLTTEQVNQLIEVIDSAIQSDAPAVVSALQNLILVASLTKDPSTGPGPLEQMVKKIETLRNEVVDLKSRHLDLLQALERLQAAQAESYKRDIGIRYPKDYSYDHSYLDRWNTIYIKTGFEK